MCAKRNLVIAYRLMKYETYVSLLHYYVITTSTYNINACYITQSYNQH